MAIKGQKFRSYPESLKLEAVRLHLDEKWTHKQIAEHLGINDKDCVKVWMRKYIESRGNLACLINVDDVRCILIRIYYWLCLKNL
ncbi:transposase [Brevibacterium sp. JNUCC-42]|nr:transposase [Brevibacterium sp. JNUCC-42]